MKFQNTYRKEKQKDGTFKENRETRKLSTGAARLANRRGDECVLVVLFARGQRFLLLLKVNLF